MLRYLVRRLFLLVPILFGVSLLIFFWIRALPGSPAASLLGLSIPIFFLAIILKYIFAVRLAWLPSVGRISVLIDMKHPTNFYILDAIIERNWHALWDVLKHLILPGIALGSIPLAVVARITRAAVL